MLTAWRGWGRVGKQPVVQAGRKATLGLRLAAVRGARSPRPGSGRLCVPACGAGGGAGPRVVGDAFSVGTSPTFPSATPARPPERM